MLSTLLALAVLVQAPVADPVVISDGSPVVTVYFQGKAWRVSITTVQPTPAPLPAPAPNPAPGPTPPAPTPAPTPTPASDRFGLSPAAKTAALGFSFDSRKKAADVFDTLANRADAGEFATPQQMTAAHLDAYRKTLTDADQWRKALEPVSHRLTELWSNGAVKTVPDLAAAWREIANGIKP
jgi:hypothetical protein